MADSYVFDGEDLDELKKVLLYRKIVEVSFNEYQGYITLDDGTTLNICPNQGCDCGAGCYYLEELNKCDNAITDISIEYDRESGYEYINIFVIAEDRRVKVIDIYGSDDNCEYYGRGFRIFVDKP